MSLQNRKQKHLDRISNICAEYVTRYGEVRSRLRKKQDSDLMTMSFKRRDFSIDILVFVSKKPNVVSTCKIFVKESGNIVLAATGSFSNKPFNMRAATYAPGEWEQRISLLLQKL